MEYIKQNDEWMILVFRWRQIFLSRYDKGWVEENLEPGFVVAQPDRPSDPSFHAPYKPDKVNLFDPPPPNPYDD